ncbi:MAG: HAD family hydrolase [bacterium]
MASRNLCFDFDGTLIDSRHDIAAAVNELRDRMGLSQLSVAEVAKAIGSGTYELVEKTFPLEDVDDVESLIEKFREIYIDLCTDNVRPYDKIPALLETLNNDRLAIVTNKPVNMTQSILSRLEWSERFDPVYGPHSFERGKPDPRPLEAVQEQWDVPISDLVMIGDSWTDIRAGNALGCRTVACLYGLGNSDETLDEEPDIIVESVKELHDTIRTFS